MNGIVRWKENSRNNANFFVFENDETKGQLKAKIMENKQLTHDLVLRLCGVGAGDVSVDLVLLFVWIGNPVPLHLA